MNIQISVFYSKHDKRLIIGEYKLTLNVKGVFKYLLIL